MVCDFVVTGRRGVSYFFFHPFGHLVIPRDCNLELRPLTQVKRFAVDAFFVVFKVARNVEELYVKPDARKAIIPFADEIVAAAAFVCPLSSKTERLTFWGVMVVPHKHCATFSLICIS